MKYSKNIREIGLSFRRGPYDWHKDSLKILNNLPFSFWEVPGWMLLDQLVQPRQPVFSLCDLISSGALMGVAEEHTERIRYSFLSNFDDQLQVFNNFPLSTMVLDFGLAESFELNQVELEERLTLVKQIWVVCHQLGYELHLPIRFPLLAPRIDQRLRYYIQSLMCGGIRISAEIHIHELGPDVDPKELLKEINFDLGSLRFCWDTESGNELKSSLLSPWIQWINTNIPDLPILLEPYDSSSIHFVESVQNAFSLIQPLLNVESKTN